jgi:response regulator RpfG family c-di-GMP phosphodiesterase
MKAPSIKTITIKTLLTVILLAALIMTIIIGLGFRILSYKIIKNETLATAELVKAGLTSHMKAKMMTKRDYYLAEIQSLHDINKIAIIRSPQINEQFGEGNSYEKKIDAVSAKVFKSKEPTFILDEFSLSPSIRGLIPYIASKNGSLNCMECHKVEEGSVLGVVDIEINVAQYRNTSGIILATILIASLILVILIVINTFRTVDTYIQVPLETLISKAEESYKKGEPLDESSFKSLEFQNVAHEINLFNLDIIKTHGQLEDKNLQLIALNDEIEETLRETVFTMGVIEEQRSKETRNHTRRVTEYCKLIAVKLGLSEHEVDLIGAAAPLHDIGKIAISDYILLKNDKLSGDEFEIMKNHTKIGQAMLVHSSRDILQVASIIASQHHERWDGSGYPEGLKGEEIHIYGRIIALADVFDALSTTRTYKVAWPLDKIIEEIKAQSGKHFDPDLVQLFLKNMDDFTAIKSTYDTK